MYSNAKSPPLHHPVPQHAIPQFGSAEVESMEAQAQHQRYVPQYQPQQQQQQQQQPSMQFGGYGNTASHQQEPQHHQNTQQSQNSFGGYSNIFADPSAQLGIEVGKNALSYGHEYIGKNINQYVSVSALKYYFQVSNIYVMKKIGLVLFPWTHRPWTRQIMRVGADGQSAEYALSRNDINAPDMYIPVMALTTYMLLKSVAAGLHGTFHPEILGYVASKSIAFLIVELLLLKLGTYLLSTNSKILDFVAYSGYKFVGINLTLLVSMVFSSSWIKWLVFFYTSLANAFFLLRSMRYILLPDSRLSSTTINSSQRQRRIQFLFVYSFITQLVLTWLLI